MIESIKWLLVFEVIAFAGLGVTWKSLQFMPARGWGFIRPIGMILTGLIVWLVSYLRILPSTVPVWWLVVGLLSCLTIFFIVKDSRKFINFIREHYKAILVTELIFVLFFVMFTSLRAFDADITGTEKPMEFMFLNSSIRAQWAPPEDAWFGGEAVPYYYFGYWMFGGIAKMSYIPASYAFNLAISSVAALSAAAMFSFLVSLFVGSNKSSSAELSENFSVGRKSTHKYHLPILFAFFGVILLLIVASLAGWLELLAHLGIGSEGFYKWLAIEGLQPAARLNGWIPDQFWWWWRASRVINSFDISGNALDNTIQEFPAFSLILADLHPHVMSIPFIITTLGFILNLWLLPNKYSIRKFHKTKIFTFMLMILLGASGFVNTWDILFLGVVLWAALAFKSNAEFPQTNFFFNGLRTLPTVAVIAAGSILIFSPFYPPFGTLQSQIQIPFVAYVPVPTRPIHFMIVWGLPLAIVSPLIFSAFKNTFQKPKQFMNKQTRNHSLNILIFALLSIPLLFWTVGYFFINQQFALDSPSSIIGGNNSLFQINPSANIESLIGKIPLLAGIALLFAFSFTSSVNLSRNHTRSHLNFILILLSIASYMIYLVELVFVIDLFGNRMNTVFKVYYQAWLLFSIISAYSLFFWWTRRRKITKHKKVLNFLFIGLVAGLLIGPFYYTAGAATSKALSYNERITLDGLSYLENSSYGEYKMIMWLVENTEKDTRLIESIGAPYTEFGRISSATGIPTVLGWPGHELQWRGPIVSINTRYADVEQFYNAQSIDERQIILDRYGIDYIILSCREYIKYPNISIPDFEAIGDVVFEDTGNCVSPDMASPRKIAIFKVASIIKPEQVK